MLKKILIVITKSEIGGAQIVALHLAKTLRTKGVVVSVAVGQKSFMTNELEKNEIPIILFKKLERTFNPFSVLAAFFEFKKFFNTHKFDAIQLNSSNSLITAVAAKLSKNKPTVIFTFHGLSYLDPNSDKNWLTKKIFYFAFKLLLPFVDKKVFVSTTNFAQAKKIGLVSKGVIIPNEVDINPLPRQEARQFLSVRTDINLNNKIIIGSIGRLAYPKNYEYLIEEMKAISTNHPDTVAIIIGEGPERKKYESLIRATNLEKKIFLTGEIPFASQYLRAFDFFVLCSKYEGASLTLIEASTLGIPILASNTGGTPDLITAENLFSLKSGALSDLFSKKYKGLPMPVKHFQYPTDTMAQQYLALIG